MNDVHLLLNTVNIFHTTYDGTDDGSNPNHSALTKKTYSLYEIATLINFIKACFTRSFRVTKHVIRNSHFS